MRRDGGFRDPRIMWFGRLLAVGSLWMGTSPGAMAVTPDGSQAAPMLDPIGDWTVEAGSVVGFTVTATDPDGDPLTFSVRNLPPGALFTPTSPTGADATLPSIPQGLTITGASSFQIELSWQAARDPESGIAHYKVYRDGAVVAQPDSTSYADGGLNPSTRYAYQVSAVNAVGLESTTSASVSAVTSSAPIGATIFIYLNQGYQTMEGVGGNYPRGRFGWTPQDAVGEYTLENLHPTHVRFGLPIIAWEHTNDDADPNSFNWDAFKDDGNIHKLFLLMQEFHNRGIPIVGSVFDVPDWAVSNPSNDRQRLIPPNLYDEVVESIAAFLIRARDVYGVPIEHISINEPDLGVDLKLTPAEYAEIIRRAGPRFAALGLRATWLAGDTSNAVNWLNYAKPLLEDPSVRPYLGPASFHSYQGTDADFQAIARLAAQYRRAVWVAELGYHPKLKNVEPDPRATWDHAMKTAIIYYRVIKHSQASALHCYHYQGDGEYSLMKLSTMTPYHAYYVVKQLADQLPVGSQVVGTASSADHVLALAAKHVAKDHFMVHLINTQSAPSTITLLGLPPTQLTVQRTSEMEQIAPVGAYPVTDGTLTLSLPGSSVTTLSGPLQTDDATDSASRTPAALQATFSWMPDGTQAGIYPDIHFEVSDGTFTASEDITITVTDVLGQAPEVINQAPVANAGASQTVASGSLVSLNGSGSYDPDGDTLHYRWTQTQGPAVNLSDPYAVNPTFFAPMVSADTTLRFWLRVGDGSLRDGDGVKITVTPPVSVPSVPQTPWQTNAYGTLITTGQKWQVASGYHFTPQVPGTITQLGGFFNGTKTVKLFRKDTGELLASATVSASDTWGFSPIAPVAVQPGTTYTVAVYLYGSGGTQRMDLSPTLPRTFGDIRILGSTSLSPTTPKPNAPPTNTVTDRMWGQADIVFVPSP